MFWRSDSCTVEASYAADGALQFSGQDLRAFGTPGYAYEYVVTVAAGQFAALRQALGVPTDADVLDAVLAHADDIMAEGEAAWLQRHGVARHVGVWSSPPDQ
jgi:hypothetical protein